MTCGPFCDSCGGNLGHASNGDWTCVKCKIEQLRNSKKIRISKTEFHEWGGFDNPELFRLQTRGRAWRYYRKVEA